MRIDDWPVLIFETGRKGHQSNSLSPSFHHAHLWWVVQADSSIMPTYPEIVPGGGLILAWQIKDKKVLLVGGGNVAAGESAFHNDEEVQRRLTISLALLKAD
jgi:hypothetical protein